MKKKIEWQDIQNAEFVELTVDDKGKLWVNVDGICRLRINCVHRLTIDTPTINSVESYENNQAKQAD